MDLSRFPYLQGNYAPIDEERDFDVPDLHIEGNIPQNLIGAFMRKAPTLPTSQSTMSIRWTATA